MRQAFLHLTIWTVVLVFAASCDGRATDNPDPPANATANVRSIASNPAASEADVKKLLTDFAAAMSKNDVIVLDKVWADDFTFITHDGEILTKAQLFDLMKSGTEKFESVTLDDVHIRTYGDTAVVAANGTQKATLEGKDHSGTSAVSIVLVKTQEGWRMVLAQLAELKPLAKTVKSTAR